MYRESTLLILFSHNKFLFYKMIFNKAIIFFSPPVQAMLLCLYNGTGRAMLLKTDEAEQGLNITLKITQIPSQTFSS